MRSWVFIGAALATGMSSLGAGFAVAKVGTAAVGALAEKPELFGRLLIFIGLAEGIAIYGLIVSILMLNRLGDEPQPLRRPRRPRADDRPSTWATRSARPATGSPARCVRSPGAGEEARRAGVGVRAGAAGAAVGGGGGRHRRAAVLRAALSALAPLVLVVPDLQGDVPLPDLAARLRAQLGLEA